MLPALEPCLIQPENSCGAARLPSHTNWRVTAGLLCFVAAAWEMLSSKDHQRCRGMLLVMRLETWMLPRMTGDGAQLMAHATMFVWSMIGVW